MLRLYVHSSLTHIRFNWIRLFSTFCSHHSCFPFICIGLYLLFLSCCYATEPIAPYREIPKCYIYYLPVPASLLHCLCLTIRAIWTRFPHQSRPFQQEVMVLRHHAVKMVFDDAPWRRFFKSQTSKTSLYMFRQFKLSNLLIRNLFVIYKWKRLPAKKVDYLFTPAA